MNPAMEVMEDRWRECRPTVTELVGFVLAADACPFGAGIAKGSSLRFIWGQDFLNRGHVDRVQPMNPPLKLFILGESSSSTRDAYHISIEDSSFGQPTPRAVGGITSRHQSVEISSRILRPRDSKPEHYQPENMEISAATTV